MDTLKAGYKQESRKTLETLKELQDKLYELKERCNDLYNRVVVITGHYMILNCEQEEVGDHERKWRVHPDKDKRKKFEAITEHADSLANNEHEPVSITSNRNNSNIEYYKKVYQMIPAGKDNAVSMSDLAKMLKTDKRQCRKIVARMRESSYQIVGDNAGYYKPSTNKELFDWYKSVHSRAMTGLKSLKYARRIMKGNGIEMSDNDIFTSDTFKKGE